MNPVYISVSGYSTKIVFQTVHYYGNPTITTTLSNDKFKSVIVNLVNYVKHNLEKIVTPRNGVYFHNGSQYKSAGDVVYYSSTQESFGTDSKVTSAKNKLVFDGNFEISQQMMYDGYTNRVREHCSKCNQWHDYSTSNLTGLCARHTEKRNSRVDPKKLSSTVEYINCTMVMALNGFTYNVINNTIGLNWKLIEMMLVN